MRIDNNYSNQTFQAKLDTASVLETTSMKIFKNEGTDGFKHVINTLSDRPMKAVGHLGYRHYAKLIGDKILVKYPEIAEATAEIKDIINKNPNIKKDDLYERIKPIINRLGEVIDITI